MSNKTETLVNSVPILNFIRDKLSNKFYTVTKNYSYDLFLRNHKMHSYIKNQSFSLKLYNDNTTIELYKKHYNGQVLFYVSWNSTENILTINSSLAVNTDFYINIIKTIGFKDFGKIMYVLFTNMVKHTFETIWYLWTNTIDIIIYSVEKMFYGLVNLHVNTVDIIIYSVEKIFYELVNLHVNMVDIIIYSVEKIFYGLVNLHVNTINIIINLIEKIFYGLVNLHVKTINIIINLIEKIFYGLVNSLGKISYLGVSFYDNVILSPLGKISYLGVSFYDNVIFWLEKLYKSLYLLNYSIYSKIVNLSGSSCNCNQQIIPLTFEDLNGNFLNVSSIKNNYTNPIINITMGLSNKIYQGDISILVIIILIHITLDMWMYLIGFLRRQ